MVHVTKRIHCRLTSTVWNDTNETCVAALFQAALPHAGQHLVASALLECYVRYTRYSHGVDPRC